MQSVVTSVFATLLFIILSPGLFLRLPNKGSKWTVLTVHSIVFFVIYYFCHSLVYQYFNPMVGKQGFSNKQGFKQQQGFANKQGFKQKQGFSNKQGFKQQNVQQGFAQRQGFKQQQGFTNPTTKKTNS